MSEQKIHHPSMVAQLAKPGSAILATMDSRRMHLIHMVIGISGEVAELSVTTGRENTIEELGDIEFYMEGLRQGLDISRSEVITKVARTLSFTGTLVSAAGDVLDLVKKHTIYNKELDLQALISAMACFEFHMITVREESDVTYQLSLDANIDKLGKRYKGHNYSDQAAHDRADKKGEQDELSIIAEVSLIEDLPDFVVPAKAPPIAPPPLPVMTNERIAIMKIMAEMASTGGRESSRITIAVAKLETLLKEFSNEAYLLGKENANRLVEGLAEAKDLADNPGVQSA